MESVENLIAKRFIARPDVKAVQQNNGAWHPERDKFTRADLQAHLDGRKTFGHYVLSAESQCKLFCYDLDLKPTGVWQDDLGVWHELNPRDAWLDVNHPSRKWQTIQLRCLSEGLALRIQRLLGLGVAITYSGAKGFHVYAFADGPEPAADMRAAAVHILDDFGCFKRVRGDHFWEHDSDDPNFGYPNIGLEVFPKQDSLDGKDLGNLLRLPLGINRKSNQRGFFVDVRCGYDTLQEADPLQALTTLNPWGEQSDA